MAGKILEGAEVVVVTSPKDAQTILVEGIKGVLMTAHLTKISFFEQFGTNDDSAGIEGKHVVNLAIPNDQLLPIIELLQRIVRESGMLADDAGETAGSPEAKA